MGRRRNKGGRSGGGAAALPAPDRGAGIGPRPPPASASAPRHARRGPRLAPDGAPEVDRERTCPLLLRIFPAATHPVPASLARLAGDGAKPPPGEVQAYTWPDATLRELASLVQEVEPGAAAAGATLDLALVYPGGGGAPTLRRVGRLRASGAGPDDRRTLRGLGFETGDLLSVAVEPPRGGGGVGGRGGGGGDGRRRPRSRSREPRRSRSRSRSPPQKQPRRTRSRSPPQTQPRRTRSRSPRPRARV
jgi:histone deacetylase complex subunit SAP18